VLYLIAKRSCLLDHGDDSLSLCWLFGVGARSQREGWLSVYRMYVLTTYYLYYSYARRSLPQVWILIWGVGLRVGRVVIFQASGRSPQLFPLAHKISASSSQSYFLKMLHLTASRTLALRAARSIATRPYVFSARASAAHLTNSTLRSLSVAASQKISNPDMMCRQCEQTKDHYACTTVGVCGKTAETSVSINTKEQRPINRFKFHRI
jgi:hypothetical protein